MSTSIKENRMEFPQKLKRELLPCDPTVPLLGINPKEMKSVCQKDTCISMIIAALFTITKI
jgi:hypothetical protein